MGRDARGGARLDRGLEEALVPDRSRTRTLEPGRQEDHGARVARWLSAVDLGGSEIEVERTAHATAAAETGTAPRRTDDTGQSAQRAPVARTRNCLRRAVLACRTKARGRGEASESSGCRCFRSAS